MGATLVFKSASSKWDHTGAGLANQVFVGALQISPKGLNLVEMAEARRWSNTPSRGNKYLDISEHTQAPFRGDQSKS